MNTFTNLVTYNQGMVVLFLGSCAAVCGFLLFFFRRPVWAMSDITDYAPVLRSKKRTSRFVKKVAHKAIEDARIVLIDWMERKTWPTTTDAAIAVMEYISAKRCLSDKVWYIKHLFAENDLKRFRDEYTNFLVAQQQVESTEDTLVAFQEALDVENKKLQLIPHEEIQTIVDLFKP